MFVSLGLSAVQLWGCADDQESSSEGGGARKDVVNDTAPGRSAAGSESTGGKDEPVDSTAGSAGGGDDGVDGTAGLGDQDNVEGAISGDEPGGDAGAVGDVFAIPQPGIYVGTDIYFAVWGNDDTLRSLTYRYAHQACGFTSSVVTFSWESQPIVDGKVTYLVNSTDEQVDMTCDFVSPDKAECSLSWWERDPNTDCFPRVEDQGVLAGTLMRAPDPCIYGGTPVVTVGAPNMDGVATIDVDVPPLHAELCPGGVPDGTEVRFELWWNTSPTLSVESATTVDGKVSVTLTPGTSASDSLFFAVIDGPFDEIASLSETLTW